MSSSIKRSLIRWQAAGQDDDQVPPATGDERSAADTEPETEPDQTGDTSADILVKTHPGRLILDATVAEQAIRFPTDLSLLNVSREISERLIDALYPHSSLPCKPRTHRQKERQAYLDVVKLRRDSTPTAIPAPQSGFYRDPAA